MRLELESGADEDEAGFTQGIRPEGGTDEHVVGTRTTSLDLAGVRDYLVHLGMIFMRNEKRTTKSASLSSFPARVVTLWTSFVSVMSM